MSTEQINSLFYTVEEAAEVLKISPTSLYKFVRSGEIKARKIGRRYLISKEYLAEWAKA